MKRKLEKMNGYVNLIMQEYENGANASAQDKAIHMKSDEFYHNYIQQTAIGKNVQALKARQDTFQIIGKISDVMAFFSSFKVDGKFMENPSQFTVYSPMYTFDDLTYGHNMGRGQQYLQTYFPGHTAPNVHDADNIRRRTIYGRWNCFVQEQGTGKKVKEIKPKLLVKMIKDVCRDNGIEVAFEDELFIVIQFQVNVQQWANSIWDAETEYSDIQQREDVNAKKESLPVLDPMKEQKQIPGNESISNSIREYIKPSKTVKEQFKAIMKNS